jgi:hypothetical protein
LLHLQLVAACHKKLRQFDEKGLAILASSLLRLGVDVSRFDSTQPEAGASGALPADSSRSSRSSGIDEVHSSSGGSAGTTHSSSSSSSFLVDLLKAVIKQLPSASSHSCSTLCNALATLLQQQQVVQQQQNNQGSQDPQQQLSQDVQQQSVLLLQLLDAVAARLKLVASAGQLSSTDACRTALAALRLAKAARELHTAAAASSVLLDAEVQALLQQAAQQAVLTAEASGVQMTVADAALLLYTLAKAKVRPGWQNVQQLLRQYSQAVHDVTAGSTAAALGSTYGIKQQQRSGAAGRSPYAHGRSAEQQESDSADLALELAQSLPSSVWAAGRLLELQRGVWKQQRQRQQQQLLLHQLQCCRESWEELSSVLPLCSSTLPSMSPMQLVQLAAGLAKLVSVSRGQVDAATAAAAATVSIKDSSADGFAAAQPSQQQQPADAVVVVLSSPADLQALQAAAEKLAGQLVAANLKVLLKQHVARSEGLLQMMPVAQRLQLADAYRQLGVQLPRSMSLVFDRDAAAAAATTAAVSV